MQAIRRERGINIAKSEQVNVAFPSHSNSPIVSHVIV